MEKPGSPGQSEDLEDELRQLEQSLDSSQTSPKSTEPQAEATQHLLGERKRVARLSRIRQIVFGSLDGLLVPLGVISGVAGGTNSTRAVIVAGLAEAFAEALSMAAGEFIAGKSEAQVQKAEIKKELEQMRQFPEDELKEMTELLKQTGVSEEDIPVIAHYLQRNPRLYAKTMVAEELGLNLEVEETKIVEGLTIGLSYIVASIVPLIAYFFLPVETALFVSLGLSFLFLVGLGILKGVLTKMSLVSSALGIVIVGTVSGLGGYLLGVWLPKLFGY